MTQDLTPEAVAALSDKLMLSARVISASKETCEAIDLASRVMPALAAKLAEVGASERQLSDAYLRIRTMLGAFDTNYGGENRFSVTEKALADLLAHREAAEAENARLREALRTADLNAQALAEIKASVDGQSDQPVRAIVYCLLDELTSLQSKETDHGK